MLLRSSTGTEYQVLTDTTCELVRIYDLLSELHLLPWTPMRLYWGNILTIHIAENSILMSEPSTLR